MIVSFDDIEGIVERARREGIIMRGSDTIFAQSRSAACLRRIGQHTLRFCGCWVAPEERGLGIGKRLVAERLAYASGIENVSTLDTYAFHPRLFVSLGFESIRTYKIGTTYLRKRL